MNRRSVLGSGCGIVASLAGCLAATDGLGGDESDSDEPIYPDDRDVPAEADMHDLYVENFDRVAHDVTLAVVRTTADALVLRAAYEAPDRRGFSIPDLLVEGRTYEITLDVTDGPASTDTRPIEACQNPHGGSKNPGIWIEDGSITFEQDDCDEIAVGAKLDYGAHESFLVDGST